MRKLPEHPDLFTVIVHEISVEFIYILVDYLEDYQPAFLDKMGADFETSFGPVIRLFLEKYDVKNTKS